MSNATVWMSVVVLSACSSDDSTKHWTALVESYEDDDMSLASYADLDLADDHAATLGSRGLIETEGMGLVEIWTVPATWESEQGAIAVHIDETVIPSGGFMPEMDFSCETAAPASLMCTFDGGESYTFEEREEEPVPEERWTLVEARYGSEIQNYPMESTYEDADGTWDQTLSAALLRDGSDVTMTMTEALSGGGALNSVEQRYYGTWTGDAQVQLQFPAVKMGYECESDGDEMTCALDDIVWLWERE